MSVFPDQADHLLRWIEALPDQERQAIGTSGPAGTFVQRGLYGRYVRDQLAKVLREHRRAESLSIVKDEALELSRNGQAWQIQTGSGGTIRADAVVLAMGNFPPGPPALCQLRRQPVAAPGRGGDRPGASRPAAGYRPDHGRCDAAPAGARLQGHRARAVAAWPLAPCPRAGTALPGPAPVRRQSSLPHDADAGGAAGGAARG